MKAPCVPGGSLKSSTPRALRLAALLGASWLAAVPVTGSGPQFASGVNAIEVYASVVDGDGQPVKGLTRDDFEILEDGVRQDLTAFVAGDFPLTVAVALDRSFSMAGTPLNAAKNGARAFLQALRPGDEAIVVGITSRVEIIAPGSAPRAEQVASVASISAWGTTPLHDAIMAGIEAVDAARGRRALVILSDGDERDSATPSSEVLGRARQSNVMVYPVALGKERPPLFAELARLTGGRSYHARDVRSVERAMVGIAEQLREQYLLGYSPRRPPVAGANEWRSITVQVKRRGVSVRARDGYLVR